MMRPSKDEGNVSLRDISNVWIFLLQLVLSSVDRSRVHRKTLTLTVEKDLQRSVFLTF